MKEGLIGPLRIDSLAFGGSGVARHDGRVIFIPGTVPGDRVRVRLLREKKRYAEARAVEIVEPSDQRCAPACPVFGSCGGCQWQMLPYAQQLRHKEQIFGDMLARQCRIASDLIAPIIPAPSPWNYRSRVQFKCHALADGRLAIGFFRGGSHFVIDIDQCPIAAPAFNRLLPKLKACLGGRPWARRIPQIDMERDDDDRVRLIVHFLGEDAAGLAQLLRPLMKETGAALYLQQGRKESLAPCNGGAELLIAVDEPPLHLAYAAGGFAQVNLEQNRRMLAAALEMAVPLSAWRVLDLYCGMGNFSIPFARRVRSLVAVEDFAASVAQGRQNARRNRIDNVRFEAASAAEVGRICAAEEGFDLAILDPPRSGAQVAAKALAAARVPRILYVSCDPMTLTRDLNLLLRDGYRLVQSRPLDMFPQTYHLESLSLLVHETRGD